MRTIGGVWALELPIGSGSFAIVWKAQHIHTGTIAAVKEINTDKLNRKLQESLASEISVLEKTKHTNIVGLLDLIKDTGKIFLVLEYCGGGDLGQYLRRYGRVGEETARYFMHQLAEGLKILRMHNLIHRDLKPQNLLLSDASRQPALKIADFGFARNLQPQGLAETLCGSPLYMAPEILQFHKYDAKADLWSVGTILFELITGKPPFNGANHIQLLQNIEKHEAQLPDPLAAQLSPACKQLVSQLLKRNPVERISFEEFFAHPFLAGAIPTSLPFAPPPLAQSKQQQQQQAQQQQYQQAQQQAQQRNRQTSAAAGHTTGPAAQQQQPATPQPQVHRQLHPQQWQPPRHGPAHQWQAQGAPPGVSNHPLASPQALATPIAAALGGVVAPQPSAGSGAGMGLVAPSSSPVVGLVSIHGLAAVDAVTGITGRELGPSRSPSPRFVVPLTSPDRSAELEPNQLWLGQQYSQGAPALHGSGRLEKGAGIADGNTKQDPEDSLELEGYVVISNPSSPSPSQMNDARQQRSSGSQPHSQLSKQQQAVDTRRPAAQQAHHSISGRAGVGAGHGTGFAGQLHAGSGAGSSPQAAAAAASAPGASGLPLHLADPVALAKVIKLPDKLDTVDLLQRVMLILMECAKMRWEGALADAERGPVAAAGMPAASSTWLPNNSSNNVAGRGSAAPSSSQTLGPAGEQGPAAVAAKLAVAAGELLSLYLFCSQMLDAALVQQPALGLGACQGNILLCSHARSLLAAMSDRLHSAARRLPAEAVVPAALDLVFDTALRFSRAAAVDELLGSYSSSVQQYAKASDLLLFLLVEVPCVVPVKPQLCAQDHQRVYKYYASVKVRQSSCMAVLNARMTPPC